jgi:hypothetical protein
VVSLRVLECVVKLVSHKDALWDVFSSFLSNLVEICIQESDVMAQINGIEILMGVSRIQHE